MAINITEKIIDIITTKFNDKDKFIKEQIQVVDDIKNFNLVTFSHYIVKYNKKLFIFDLKILGREWIKNTKFIPNNIINEDKYKDNIHILDHLS